MVFSIFRFPKNLTVVQKGEATNKRNPYLYQSLSPPLPRRKFNTKKQQDLVVKILKLLNQSEKQFPAIKKIIELIKNDTGFEAVGIRLHNGEDFP